VRGGAGPCPTAMSGYPARACWAAATLRAALPATHASSAERKRVSERHSGSGSSPACSCQVQGAGAPNRRRTRTRRSGASRSFPPRFRSSPIRPA
jgi:hypothetical protein